VNFAQQPAPAGPPKLQVLIITGQNGHNWRGTTPILRRILEDTEKFEVHVTEEFRGAGPETLAPYDLVVVNYQDRGTVDFGKGRVFTTALGHDVEQVQTPAFTTTFARGAEWAATGKVTLPIPAAMAK
jgi:hypothetical protein